MILVSGTAHPMLARDIARRRGIALAAVVLDRFPDGELHVELRESVRGRNVFLLQPTNPPVEQHLFELLLMADACRRAGARQRIAVIPYFGYARQDRRAKGRDPIAARLVTDLLSAAGVDRVIVVDLHSRAIEGFFTAPAEHLSAVPLLAESLRADVTPQTVIVAPDLGAVKLADRYGEILGCPVATVYKTRLSPREVTVRQIVGEVRDKVPFIVDDMISTGATVAAAVRALIAAGCRPDLTVVATHGVFSALAADTLAALPISRVITTDSVAPPANLALPVETVAIGSLLAEAIERLDRDESMAALTSHA